MAIFVVLLMLMAGCSSSKLIPEEEYLLEKVQVKTDDKHLDVGYLEPYIRQKPTQDGFLCSRFRLQRMRQPAQIRRDG